MSELDFTKATASSLSTVVQDYSVASKVVDSATDQEETTWQNNDWAKQWGYFNAMAELKSALIMKAIWTVGKGYTADPETTVILDHVSGWGKDSFLDVLFNMCVCMRVGGDAFAEIIRDEDSSTLINLKPLDSGSMKIVVGPDGIIKRYEQIKNGKTIKFKPDEVFHLSNNRMADQIHGISDITALEKTILAQAESADDGRKIYHRQAKPMIMFKLGTDDQAKITAFIAKMDAATNKGENIYIPDDKNSVNFEVVQVDVANSFLAWRADQRNEFYRALGLPQVIFGQGQATESGGKMEVYANETVWSREQLFIETQVWNQLNLKLKLNPPTTLLDSLKKDEQADNNQQLGLMPKDLTAGTESRNG